MRHLLLFCSMTAACGDVENPDTHDEGELITTVTLTLSAQGDDRVTTYTWTDPEADGDPVIDTIVVDASTTWDVSVALLDSLQEPPEDITPEIRDEAEEHQLFFTGTAVRGPATGDAPDAIVLHTYVDTDANGAPLGLENTLAPIAAGAAELVVTLRHLPPQDGTPQKTANLAEDAARDGVDALPGEVDAQVRFPIRVE